MNPAEEIVKFWLQQKGYFLQSSIRLPKNKEIDILAIDPKGNKYHIEVSVSVRMANYKLNAKQLAKHFQQRKFKDVAHEVKKIIGKKYKKIFVAGELTFKGKSIEKEFIEECGKFNIDILKLRNILCEVIPTLSTHSHLNPVIKSIQLAHIFGK